MQIFLDESGYTGEDLKNKDQPIFVLASTNLKEQECRAIFKEVFSGIQAEELKHSTLTKKPSGQERIVNFTKILLDNYLKNLCC